MSIKGRYRPSHSTGLFGSYTIGRQYSPNQPKLDIIRTLEYKHKNGNITNIHAASGSIVDFVGDCIVNAANGIMLGGGGVDGAISNAGGKLLDKHRKDVPSNKNGIRCETGEAKITASGYPLGKLNCDYVIHSVGPQYPFWIDDNNDNNDANYENDKRLYYAYANILKIASDYKWFKNIGFCLISAGIFKGNRSLIEVLIIGIQSIYDNLDLCHHLKDIYIIGYTYEEKQTVPNVLQCIFLKQQHLHPQFASLFQNLATFYKLFRQGKKYDDNENDDNNDDNNHHQDKNSNHDKHHANEHNINYLHENDAKKSL